MGRLVELARPMGITCHRAFDMTRDPFEALDALIALGIDRVLTSGQADSALAGAPLIRAIIARAAGRIIVMPGHGIKEHNMRDAIRLTGASEYHLYLPKQVPTAMTFIRDDVKMGSPDLSEYSVTLVDADKVGVVKRVLQDDR
jgi:copper homeostasis protein